MEKLSFIHEVKKRTGRQWRRLPLLHNLPSVIRNVSGYLLGPVSIELMFIGIKNREMTGVGVTEIREILDDGGFVRMNIVDGFAAVVEDGGHSFIFLCVLSVYC